MLNSLALSVLLGFQALPATRDFSYTGIPYLTGEGAALVAVPTHSATIELASARSARVTSTTQFRNTGDSELKLSLQVPWKVNTPTSDNAGSFGLLRGTWNGKELPLISTRIFPPTGATAQVTLPPRSTASFKLSLEQPIGQTGAEFKQRIVGYALTGDQTIGQLNLTYRYAGNLSGTDVFRLPEAQPKYAWQIGDRGAFVRLNGFQPKGEVTYLKFYPGGFDDIG